MHFESGFLWFVRSAISILVTMFDGGHVVVVVFLSCWAKRRLSMAWSFKQRDANRHNRKNRGITFDSGGRFMHRCQPTSGESCGVLKKTALCQGLTVWWLCTSPRCYNSCGKSKDIKFSVCHDGHGFLVIWILVVVVVRCCLSFGLFVKQFFRTSVAPDFMGHR